MASTEKPTDSIRGALRAFVGPLLILEEGKMYFVQCPAACMFTSVLTG